MAYNPEIKPNNEWSIIKTPKIGFPESIGSYANGCMIGEKMLEESGGIDFHVRLSCPKYSLSCKNQNPPPVGDGCNDDLYHWVNEKSWLLTGRIKPKKFDQKRASRVFPKLYEVVKRN